MTKDEIRAIRDKMRLSRKDFAKLLGTPYETLCRWENGQRSPSRFYESKLREVSGTRMSDETGEVWIFNAANLIRVSRAVAHAQGDVYGIVYAPADWRKRFVVARIRIRPELRSLEDTAEYFNGPKDPRLYAVASFVAKDHGVHPSVLLVQFMKEMRFKDIEHCVLFDRNTREMGVWRVRPATPARLTGEYVLRVAYHVVGTEAPWSAPQPAPP
ncbi:MAG: helix-turn-helix domain-containing protein [Phycisphaerae bacterium]|nr:helix-turn-helix domain-containing protein [Phycisphaerae bacterium]